MLNSKCLPLVSKGIQSIQSYMLLQDYSTTLFCCMQNGAGSVTLMGRGGGERMHFFFYSFCKGEQKLSRAQLWLDSVDFRLAKTHAFSLDPSTLTLSALRVGPPRFLPPGPVTTTEHDLTSLSAASSVQKSSQENHMKSQKRTDVTAESPRRCTILHRAKKKKIKK